MLGFMLGLVGNGHKSVRSLPLPLLTMASRIDDWGMSLLHMHTIGAVLEPDSAAALIAACRDATDTAAVATAVEDAMGAAVARAAQTDSTESEPESGSELELETDPIRSKYSHLFIQGMLRELTLQAATKAILHKYAATPGLLRGTLEERMAGGLACVAGISLQADTAAQFGFSFLLRIAAGSRSGAVNALVAAVGDAFLSTEGKQELQECTQRGLSDGKSVSSLAVRLLPEHFVFTNLNADATQFPAASALQLAIGGTGAQTDAGAGIEGEIDRTDIVCALLSRVRPVNIVPLFDFLHCREVSTFSFEVASTVSLSVAYSSVTLEIVVRHAVAVHDYPMMKLLLEGGLVIV